ncbi:MAG TPA: beta-N-acetylhexosaminidase [Burkholderiales bacterium]|nr:beta-N-acetylhexosaminidase [Burkholderiales bacterium]
MQPLGPVMLDVAALRLDDADRARLLHPLTGGIILFKRNFESAEQLAELTAEIRALRSPELLIAVDHEGGRVQRFRTGYTTLPPMAALGALWNTDRPAARRCAESAGFVIATELAASGVDFSFTPVLDLDYSRSGVIGDRAFHRDAGAVSELASALITGLARGGAAAVGKHFPGHGYAAEDSHVAIPVDSRALADIEAADMVPYRRLAALLAAVMPAHVIYPQIDSAPAGFSSIWLQNILRRELGFDGMIFSDDLSMEGATVAGGIVERAQAALAAGCDMVLVCNRPQLADELLAGLRWQPHERWSERVARMRARPSYPSLNELHSDPVYRTALAELQPVLAAVVVSSATSTARS